MYLHDGARGTVAAEEGCLGFRVCGLGLRGILIGDELDHDSIVWRSTPRMNAHPRLNRCDSI